MDGFHGPIEQVMGISLRISALHFDSPLFKMTANLVSWIKRKGIKVILFTKGKQVRFTRTEISFYLVRQQVYRIRAH